MDFAKNSLVPLREMSLVSKDWHFSSKKIREEIYAKGHAFIGRVDARLFPLVRSFLSSYAKDIRIERFDGTQQFCPSCVAWCIKRGNYKFKP